MGVSEGMPASPHQGLRARNRGRGERAVILLPAPQQHAPVISSGDILIPDLGYHYCLRVDKVSDQSEWMKPYLHISCTRFDMDDARQPVIEGRGDPHHVLHAVPLDAEGLWWQERDIRTQYQDADDVWHWDECFRPQVFQRKPKSGQMSLF
jgi:hypothetical protein